MKVRSGWGADLSSSAFQASNGVVPDVGSRCLVIAAVDLLVDLGARANAEHSREGR